MNRTALIAMASVCLIGAPALAQDAAGSEAGAREGQRRDQVRQRQQQLDPEQAKAAWTLQAQGVASRLELDDAQTTKVVDAYIAARTSYGKALREQREKMRGARGEGRGEGRGQGRGEAGGQGRGEGAGDGSAAGGGRGDRGQRAQRGQRGGFDREAMQALAKADRKKLEASLAEVLSGKQLVDATRVLGSFNPQWDRLVNVVVGLDAGEEKTKAALARIEKYVATTAKIRADGDRETMRESMRDARDELHTSLSYVLTEPQVETVLASMRGRRGFGRDRQGGGRGQFGRDDA